MTPRQQAMIEDVRPRVGARAIVTDAAAIAPWLTDWRGRFHGAAPAMIEPASTAEVAAIVAAAARHRVPLVAQGGNTSMVGGATPPGDGAALVLSLRRMTRIRSLDAAAGVLVAEAGVILEEVHRTAEAAGWRFPLTLGARGSATIGGLASTNAGGVQVLRFGSMRALVGGVEAVLADGTVHDGLAALVKDNRGYDLDGLLIGAEGTLGIVTAVALRLAPMPAELATAWVGVADPAAALALLRRFRRAGEGVESFEIVPDHSVDAVVAYLPGVRAPLAGAHRWQLLVEVAGAGAAARMEAVLADALEAGLVADAAIAANEAQRAAWWRLRDAISPAERALGPATQHDIAVPVAAMPGFMTAAAAACEVRFPGTRASGFGHLGDGNIHFHVRAPHGADAARWYADAAPVVTRFVHDLVVAAGGSIAAEHGIGQMKAAELARTAPPARLAMLRAIKAALDPLGILNPGKLVNLAPEGPPPYTPA